MSQPKTRVLLSWSSGKDSAWSLHLLRQRPDLEVVALATSFNAAAGRVAMHGVRRELVESQAGRLNLPLWSVDLPWPCSNAEYEDRMRAVWHRAAEEGIAVVAFGDLFLEDIRAYRISQLNGTGLEPVFPLWGLPTAQLARQMLASGMQAKITCIDSSKLDQSFSGINYDDSFIASLPPTVDPCGENGEFHTFVFNMPDFSESIKVCAGAREQRDGFVFADLLPLALPVRDSG